MWVDDEQCEQHLIECLIEHATLKYFVLAYFEHGRSALLLLNWISRKRGDTLTPNMVI